MPPSPWKTLELISGQSALPRTWRRLMSDCFVALRILCLEPEPELGGLIPCPNDCGCEHRIIPRHDRTGALAICRCFPPECADIEMTIEEATPLQLNFPKLGRAIARALGCHLIQANGGSLNTLQIGSWSSDAVPVFLSIQTERQDLNHAVTHLAATLREKFILLTPTKRLLTADTQQMLALVNAGIFDLASIITLRADGGLELLQQPDHLFAKFSPEADRPPATARSNPRYALHKGLGVWHLIFNYQEADIRHEKGMFYVAWLLYHPDDTPIHALDLMAKVPEIYREQLGLPTLTDPISGKTIVVGSGARIQERSLALDDRESMRRLYKKQKELEAILDSGDATEPEKVEALRELEEMTEFQRRHARGTGDSARRAAHAVRSAVARFHENIASAVGKDGGPHAVLRAFADHVHKHILVPSARYAGHGGPYARAGLAGCFTYEPQMGVRWEG